MALTATEQAHLELAALRTHIAECRRELGLEASKPVQSQAKRSLRLRTGSRGSGRARRQAGTAA